MPSHIRYVRTPDVEEFLIWAKYKKCKKENNDGYKIGYSEVAHGFNDSYKAYRLGEKEFDGITDLLYVKKIEVAGEAVQENAPVPPKVRKSNKASKSVAYVPTGNLSHVYCYNFRPVKIVTKTKRVGDRGRLVDLDYEGTLRVRNYYESVPRVIMIEDLTSISTLENKLMMLANTKKPLELSKWKNVNLEGFIVEGVNFNKSYKLPDSVKSKFIDHNSFVQIENIVISTGNAYAIQAYRDTFPIDETAFLIAMKDHFISRMNNTVARKEEELKTLKDRLLNLQKEVSELSFIENSIKSSSNEHFNGMIQRIRSLPTVSSLIYSKNGMSIITKPLYAEPDEDQKVYIGTFEILIEITNKFAAKARNIAAPTVYGGPRFHPHGTCKGSHYGVMLNAIKSLDYYTFILAAIEMLQTVNPNEKTFRGMLNAGYEEKMPCTSKLTVMSNYYSLVEDNPVDNDGDDDELEDDDDGDDELEDDDDGDDELEDDDDH